jgi:hypothetical protein
MEKSTLDRKKHINYYELFEIPFSASPKQILLAYENKITKFNNLQILSQEQINEIKLLKVGLFILINNELRYNYNKIVGFIKTNKQLSNKTIDNDPVADNQCIPDTLDSLFNMDNSWMKSTEQKPGTSSKKGKNESNMLGDRIFSLSEFNRRPGFSSDFETELRKPQQGRIDKSDLKITKSDKEKILEK